MAVKLRLQRHGRKKRPFYFIVVADSRNKRDGNFIERLGSYDPTSVPATIDIDRDKALTWLQKGAQPTETVKAILSFTGVLYKKHLMRGVAKGAMTSEQAETKFTEWLAAREKLKADKRAHAEKARIDEFNKVEKAAREKREKEETAKAAAKAKAAEAKAVALEKEGEEEVAAPDIDEVARQAAIERGDTVPELPTKDEAETDAPAEEASTEEPVAETEAPVDEAVKETVEVENEVVEIPETVEEVENKTEPETEAGTEEETKDKE